MYGGIVGKPEIFAATEKDWFVRSVERVLQFRYCIVFRGGMLMGGQPVSDTDSIELGREYGDTELAIITCVVSRFCLILLAIFQDRISVELGGVTSHTRRHFDRSPEEITIHDEELIR